MQLNNTMSVHGIMWRRFHNVTRSLPELSVGVQEYGQFAAWFLLLSADLTKPIVSKTLRLFSALWPANDDVMRTTGAWLIVESCYVNNILSCQPTVHYLIVSLRVCVCPSLCMFSSSANGTARSWRPLHCININITFLLSS